MVVQSGDGCPPEWAEKFLPMITCNRCADLRFRRVTITDSLYKTCTHLCVLKQLERNGSTARINELRKKLTEALDKLCRAYMEVIANYYNMTWNQPCDDFVTLLLEKPDRVDQCLRFIRQNFRKSIAPQPTYK
jgi:hypothetical protein